MILHCNFVVFDKADPWALTARRERQPLSTVPTGVLEDYRLAGVAPDAEAAAEAGEVDEP
jgi:hypothetical protein